MPTVPRYTDYVQDRPLPESRQPMIPSVPGMETAQAVSKFGQVLSNIATQEAENQNKIRVRDADAQLSESMNSLLYDPNKGATSRKGTDAFNVLDQTLPEFDKAATKIREGLSNDRQKSLFDGYYQQRRNMTQEVLQKHTLNQMDAHEQKSSEAEMQALENDTMNNPGALENSLRRVDESTNNRSVYRGWGRDDVKAWSATQRSRMINAAISKALADGDVNAAQAIMDKYGKAKGQGSLMGEGLADTPYFVGHQAITASAQLTTQKQKAAEQQAAIAIWTQYPDNPTAGFLAADKLDSKVQNGAKALLGQRYQIMQAQNQAENNNMVESATKIILGGGSYSSIPPNVEVKLYPDQKKDLQTLEGRLRSGNPAKTDPNAHAEFLSMTQQQLYKMPLADLLTKYVTKMSTADANWAVGQWKAARETAYGPGANIHKGAAYDKAENYNDSIRRTLVDIGAINPKPPGGKPTISDNEKISWLHRRGQIAIQAYIDTQLGGKRDVTAAEQQQILDSIANQKVFKEKAWGMLPRSEEPAGSLNKSAMESAKFPSAPMDNKGNVNTSQMRIGETYTIKGVNLIYNGRSFVPASDADRVKARALGLIK